MQWSLYLKKPKFVYRFCHVLSVYCQVLCLWMSTIQPEKWQRHLPTSLFFSEDSIIIIIPLSYIEAEVLWVHMEGLIFFPFFIPNYARLDLSFRLLTIWSSFHRSVFLLSYLNISIVQVKISILAFSPKFSLANDEKLSTFLFQFGSRDKGWWQRTQVILLILDFETVFSCPLPLAKTSDHYQCPHCDSN